MIDEYLRAIGRITVNFSYLEHVVAFGIISLVSPDQGIGQIITASMSFQQKTATLDALYRYKLTSASVKEPSRAEAMKTLMDRANHGSDERNTFMHSAWTTQEDAPEIVGRLKITAKIGKGLTHHAPQVSVEQLNGLADELATVGKEIIAFLVPLQDKSKPNS